MESISDAPQGIPEGLQVDSETREELLKEDALDPETRECFELISNIRTRAHVLSGREASNITVYPNVNWKRKEDALH